MSDADNRIRNEAIVVMVGTSVETMGGISTVVKGYISAGLLDLVPIEYVTTHADGNAARKIRLAASGYGSFLRILATRNVSLVHIHLSSRASFWRKLPFVLSSMLLRKPVLLHLHGSEFMTFYLDECGPMRKRVVKFAFNHADAVIVLSPQWAENVRKIASDPNIEIIFNGVPVGDQQPDRSDHEGPVRILFLGRLGRRKGIYDLLDALVAVRDSGTDFRLIAAGDGEIAEVQSRARQLGLATRIEVPGWINEQQKNRFLQQADIFVLPSHAEGLPMSLLEAMAAGLPCVCSSVGGIPTALSDGSEGFLVAPGDTHALANALIRLSTDAELRKTLGRNAYKRAKNTFDVRQSVNQLVALYEHYRIS